jgi:hypothetical protein
MMVVSYPRGVYARDGAAAASMNSLVPFEPCSVSSVGNYAAR